MHDEETSIPVSNPSYLNLRINIYIYVGKTQRLLIYNLYLSEHSRLYTKG